MSVRVVRAGAGGVRFSVRVRRRSAWVAGALLAIALALFVVAVGTGDFPISPGDVVSALLGQGDAGTEFIVRGVRLPRVVCAVAIGAGLGIAGAVFQALTRNPLGSPDVVGFSGGASFGALVVITVLGGSGAVVSAGALAGGGLTALAVYLLAFRRGSASGYQIILIGIAISFLMLSLVDFLLARARIEDAQEATRWLLGSLNDRTWDDVRPMAIALGLAVPALPWAARALNALELGDDYAAALGVRVERSRLVLILLAVGLTSMATVAAGPVAFVALIAPQIARRLTRAPGPPLVCSALMGAVIVLVADVLAQRVVSGTPLPVGVMTGAVGGVYLAWLLVMQWRSGRA